MRCHVYYLIQLRELFSGYVCHYLILILSAAGAYRHLVARKSTFFSLILRDKLCECVWHHIKKLYVNCIYWFVCFLFIIFIHSLSKTLNCKDIVAFADQIKNIISSLYPTLRKNRKFLLYFMLMCDYNLTFLISILFSWLC